VGLLRSHLLALQARSSGRFAEEIIPINLNLAPLARFVGFSVARAAPDIQALLEAAVYAPSGKVKTSAWNSLRSMASSSPHRKTKAINSRGGAEPLLVLG